MIFNIRYTGLLFIFLVSVTQSQGQQISDQITVDKIWTQYAYTANRVPGFNFLNNGQFYTRLENNNIVKYNLLSGKAEEIIVKGDALGSDIDIDSYHFSDDESKILIESEKESIYRRSSKAYVHVYDLKSEQLTSVFDDDKVMSATLSPNAEYVAYGWENNLYYFNLSTGETLPITTDGVKNEIINGICDWVYEEEFSFTKAFFWSPDSEKISFIRFDESDVPEFTMTNYKGGLYPEYETFKYPKVGESNAKVSVHVYNLTSDAVNKLNVGDLNDMYVPRIKWSNNPDQLAVYVMNRHQNHLKVLLNNVTDGSTRMIIDEKNQYYVDITDDLTFLKNEDAFIWSSEKSGFNHLYKYDLKGKELKALTKGDFDVTSFYGVDEHAGKLFYQGAAISPMSREVYEVSLDGNDRRNITPKDGTNSASFSSDYNYFTWINSAINRPASYTIMDRQLNEVRVLENNGHLTERMKQVSPAEFISIETGKGINLNAYVIKPTDFDESKQYPVLMYVYGGPGSQTVTDSWKGQNYWWFQLLAQQGYMVVSVDNRGTGSRGEEFKKMTYLQLGKYETEDQIDAAKYLANLPFVDGDRIGIFGWSYGGFMASHCILQGNDVFDTAIAVAPVTNWKWYDTIYTERFMRTGQENEDGYELNSPITYADRLEGSYLLVHGNSDDNVHFQNSAEMAAALIKADKQFDTYFYPNRNHGIFGDNARKHLYTKMTAFLLENL